MLKDIFEQIQIISQELFMKVINIFIAVFSVFFVRCLVFMYD